MFTTILLYYIWCVAGKILYWGAGLMTIVADVDVVSEMTKES